MASTLIVSPSGIRGVVGSGLTPEVAARYGAAYGTRLREERSMAGRVLLARDSRPSGPLLLDAVASGVRASGWSVLDLGVVPTPTALLAVQDDPEAVGGVILTASHNPAGWNGLKLANPRGEFLSPEAGRRVEEIYGSGPAYVGWEEVGDRTELTGAGERHVDRILSVPLVEAGRTARAEFTVGLDTVRGAAGPVMTSLLRRLGCEVAGLDLEPDGRFSRNPEPLPENLAALGRRVREAGARLGLALDPDGDRLALVDEEGEPMAPDWTLALAVDYVLERKPGPVVTNLSTSRVVRDVVERHGEELHLSPVGEAAVARRMREVGAVVGGEGNGGVILPDLHLTRDAPLAAALVLGFLAGGEKPLSRILAQRAGYHMVRRRAPRGEVDLDEVYRALTEDAPSGALQDRQDGLRLDWPEERAWVQVRPSGTEPIVRVMAEAPEAEKAEELAEWALGIVRRGDH